MVPVKIIAAGSSFVSALARCDVTRLVQTYKRVAVTPQSFRPFGIYGHGHTLTVTFRTGPHIETGALM